MKKIEENVFKSYIADERLLSEFGFTEQNGVFTENFEIVGGEFTAIVTVKGNEVDGKIIENAFNEEYTLFRVENSSGAFVGSIRAEYEKVLIKVRDNCFKKVSFPDAQAVRISDYIFNRYGDRPSFVFAKFPYYGVFKNQNNKKWYALIGDVKQNALGKGEDARFIINVKPSSENFNEYLKIKNVFPAYHMNKKSWLTLSLGNYLDDEFIKKLVDESYEQIDGK